MAEENNDAKADSTPAPATEVAEPGPSPEINTEPNIDDDGLISTTDFEEVKSEVEVKPEADISEGAEHNTPDGKSSEIKDFHKHPDWIAREEKHKAEIEAFNRRIANLEAKTTQAPKETPKEQTGPKLNLDWSNMDDEKMIEAVTDSPRAFFTDLVSLIKNDIKQEQSREKEQMTAQQRREKSETVIKEYFTKTDGAMAMWQDGSIQKYIDENPGETAISAHKALTEESRVKAATDKAVAKALEDYKKQLKAAGKAGSNATPSSGNISPDDDSPELKHPDKFGGEKAVAVKRYLRRLAG